MNTQTLLTVPGPCWQDMERRVPADTVGQTVAVAEGIGIVDGQRIAATQPIASMRPVISRIDESGYTLLFEGRAEYNSSNYVLMPPLTAGGDVMDDLKQRLRATRVLAKYENGGTLEQVRNPDGAEAAAALDAKDAEIARLRGALEWIALRIPPYEPALVVMREGYMPDRSAREVAHDVIACARAALSATTKE